MIHNQASQDLLERESVVASFEVLTEDDPIFDATKRLGLSESINGIMGEFKGMRVPFAAFALPHHKAIAEQNLYSCFFGRDSLLISELLDERVPGLRKSTVLALAQVQGERFEPISEEEPGRIPHEIREDDDLRGMEISKSEGWKFPYYGSVDATLIWLRGVRDLVKRREVELDLQIGVRTLSWRAQLAANWVVNRLDSVTGFVQSQSPNENGILNQVWKDSGDSYQDATGTIATSLGTASVETVSETFDALVASAELSKHGQWNEKPSHYIDLALSLRERFISKFLQHDYPVMGIQMNGNEIWHLDSSASNQGRLLDSTLLADLEFQDLRKQIASEMVGSGLLGPNGIRTLSKTHTNYRPGGYHTGSSWPMDSAFVTRGLLRHGFFQEAREIAHRTCSAIEAVGGYPEMFRSDGIGRDSITRFVTDAESSDYQIRNRISQPPQAMQGWSIAAYSWLVSSGILDRPKVKALAWKGK